MDPIYFSGKELIEIALRVEENGWSFYHEAEKGAENEETKSLFNYLAGQELKHIEDFKRLYKLVKEERTRESVDLTYDEEIALYLKALADSKVFTDPGEGFRRARALKDDREAIEVAIGFEKDSLLFYHEMSKIIREEDKKIVESLIAQEREHLLKLNEIKKRYAT